MDAVGFPSQQGRRNLRKLTLWKDSVGKIRNDWISGCNKGLWCNSLVSIEKTCWGWCEKGCTGTRLLLLLAIGVKWDGRRSSPWSCKTALETSCQPVFSSCKRVNKEVATRSQIFIWMNEVSCSCLDRQCKLELWYRTLLRPGSLVRRYFRLYVRNSAKDFEKSQRGCMIGVESGWLLLSEGEMSDIGGCFTGHIT